MIPVSIIGNMRRKKSVELAFDILKSEKNVKNVVPPFLFYDNLCFSLIILYEKVQ